MISLMLELLLQPVHSSEHPRRKIVAEVHEVLFAAIGKAVLVFSKYFEDSCILLPM